MGTQNKRLSVVVFRVLLVAATVFLAFAVAARVYPGLVLLVRPGLISRSPYCSRWKAVRDARIMAGQNEEATRIARASHVLRRDAGLVLWQTPAGEFWVPGSDDAILPILLAQSNRRIYGGRRWGVRPGDIVLDCGAYVGTYTRWALAGGAKLVVAIEPSPDSVECLRRNLAKEIAGGKVIIYPKGVWDSEGTLPLFVNPDNTAGNSFLPGGKELPGIPVTTIDKLVRELKLPRVDFIKADVKGATERMMRGGSDAIALYRPRLALSTEEVEDDPYRIAVLAKKIQPAYEVKCGPCLLHPGEMYTDVMFFR